MKIQSVNSFGIDAIMSPIERVELERGTLINIGFMIYQVWISREEIRDIQMINFFFDESEDRIEQYFTFIHQTKSNQVAEDPSLPKRSPEYPLLWLYF